MPRTTDAVSQLSAVHEIEQAQHVKNALAPSPYLMIGGWYDDRLASVDGQWLITVRTGTALWYDGNPEVLGYPMPAGALPPTPGHACPPWLRLSGST
jgi:hypothetical protein